MCAEPEHQLAESVTKHEDISGSYQLMLQQMKQPSEEMEPLEEQLSKSQMTSQLHKYRVIITTDLTLHCHCHSFIKVFHVHMLYATCRLNTHFIAARCDA